MKSVGPTMWQCGKSNFLENYFKYRTNGNKSNLHSANMILDSNACFFLKVSWVEVYAVGCWLILYKENMKKLSLCTAFRNKAAARFRKQDGEIGFLRYCIIPRTSISIPDLRTWKWTLHQTLLGWHSAQELLFDKGCVGATHFNHRACSFLVQGQRNESIWNRGNKTELLKNKVNN